MLERITKIIFTSRFFLPLSCATIFLLSIFLRSTIDIGADTGVYLVLGKKIANGGRYYYDFFESNFPISFYFYALEYQLSQLLHINPIILSEIVINLLALLVIFWSSKILKFTTIYDNKAHYNLIIIGFFIGFFLRPLALQNGEFGTKTSLLLLLLYPYISFSFVRKFALTKKDLACRGLLMGLMPCIKPHYLVFVIFIELHNFFQKKSPRFFFEFDKLVMYLVGVLYLFLMIKFTPEFFEFMVPMWQKFYAPYRDYHHFLENVWLHLALRVSVFSFIFLILSRLKFSANDKILALFFAAGSSLTIMESLSTIDQIVIFYAISTICVLKFSFDLFASKQILFSENKFIITALIFIPLFDAENLQAVTFGLGGFINAWWLLALIYPFVFAKKLQPQERQKFFAVKNILCFFGVYSLLLTIAVLLLKYCDGWRYITFNLLSLLVILFIFEKRIHSKFDPNFSPFSVFTIIASVACLFHLHLYSIFEAFTHKSRYTHPNKLSDLVTYYSQSYAPKKEDGIVMVSTLDSHQFPMLNYLEKEIYQKFHVAVMQAGTGLVESKMRDQASIFTFSYLFDDLKNQLKNPNVKVLFINNSADVLNKKNYCLISSLEYYFLDQEFRKIFFENFHFLNHAILIEEVQPLKEVQFMSREKPSVFDAIEPTTAKVSYDFEVYVRNEKN